jgi:hypothetical protein
MYEQKKHVPKAVLWIRIGFRADPDPAFYLNADTDPIPIHGAKPMRIHADPDSGRTLPSLPVELLHEKYSIIHRYKSLFERLAIRFIC